MNELGNGTWDKDYQPSGISKAEEFAGERYPHYEYWGSVGDSLRAACMIGYEQAVKETAERAIAWLKENANKYIVDLTPTYPDAPANIIVGGMCWEHLKDYLQNE